MDTAVWRVEKRMEGLSARITTPSRWTKGRYEPVIDRLSRMEIHRYALFGEKLPSSYLKEVKGHKRYTHLPELTAALKKKSIKADATHQPLDDSTAASTARLG